MKYYSTGAGLINSAINKLPIELHVPGYKFLGPGTHLDERLARGDKPKNKLDEAAMEHDIFYKNHKHTKERHQADKVLAKKAMKRFRSSDASLGEKIAALATAGVMKAKVKLGMGLPNNNKHIKQCGKILEKTRTSLETSHKNIQECLQLLNLNQSSPKTIAMKKERSNQKKLKAITKRITKEQKTKLNNIDIDLMDKVPINKNKRKFSSPSKTSTMTAKRKPHESNIKKRKTQDTIELNDMMDIDEDYPPTIKNTFERKRKISENESTPPSPKKLKLQDPSPDVIIPSYNSKKRKLIDDDDIGIPQKVQVINSI